MSGAPYSLRVRVLESAARAAAGEDARRLFAAVICDGCGAVAHLAADADVDAALVGWRRGPGGDRCSACLARDG